MNTGQVWKRLLWKNFIESRIVLIVALIVPAVLFPMIKNDADRPIFAILAIVIVHFVIILWAAGRGDTKRSGGEFTGTHLPVNPALDWLAGAVVPAVMLACVGLWFGWFARYAYGSMTRVPLPAAGAVDLAATYLVCYFISLVVSSWLGIFIGIAKLIGGTIISPDGSFATLTSDVAWVVVRTIIGSLAGSFYYAVLSRKLSPARRQAISLLLMIGITLIPSLFSLDMNVIRDAVRPTHDDSSVNYEITSDYDYQDIQIDYRSLLQHREIMPAIKFRDIRNNITVTNSLKPNWNVLGVKDRSVVLIAQQINGRGPVKILEWNTKSNRMKKLFEFKVRPRALLERNSGNNLSPDGRYAIVLMRAITNDKITDTGNEQSDLWALDMKEERAEVIAFPNNTAFDYMVVPYRIAWKKNSAIFSMGDDIYSLDLKTLRANTIKAAR